MIDNWYKLGVILEALQDLVTGPIHSTEKHLKTRTKFVHKKTRTKVFHKNVSRDFKMLSFWKSFWLDKTFLINIKVKFCDFQWKTWIFIIKTLWSIVPAKGRPVLFVHLLKISIFMNIYLYLIYIYFISIVSIFINIYLYSIYLLYLYSIYLFYL